MTSEVVVELRQIAEWLQKHGLGKDGVEDCLEARAADRIEALEAEAERLEAEKAAVTQHAVEFFTAGCNKHDSVVRELSFPKFLALAEGHTCPLCNRAEVKRLREALDKYQADDVRYLQARAKWRTEVERLTAQVEKWKWERHYWHEQYLKEVLGNTPEAQDE